MASDSDNNFTQEIFTRAFAIMQPLASVGLQPLPEKNSQPEYQLTINGVAVSYWIPANLSKEDWYHYHYNCTLSSDSNILMLNLLAIVAVVLNHTFPWIDSENAIRRDPQTVEVIRKLQALIEEMK